MTSPRTIRAAGDSAVGSPMPPSPPPGSASPRRPSSASMPPRRVPTSSTRSMRPAWTSSRSSSPKARSSTTSRPRPGAGRPRSPSERPWSPSRSPIRGGEPEAGRSHRWRASSTTHGRATLRTTRSSRWVGRGCCGACELANPSSDRLRWSARWSVARTSSASVTTTWTRPPRSPAWPASCIRARGSWSRRGTLAACWSTSRRADRARPCATSRPGRTARWMPPGRATRSWPPWSPPRSAPHRWG